MVWKERLRHVNLSDVIHIGYHQTDIKDNYLKQYVCNHFSPFHFFFFINFPILRKIPLCAKIVEISFNSSKNSRSLRRRLLYKNERRSLKNVQKLR